MSSRPTILLADDDRSIRVVVRQSLEDAGYEVIALGSLSALRQRLELGDGDLLITDVLMPDGNALDLLPDFQEHRPDLPIIVISAQNTLATAVRAARERAYDYLPKPFDLEDLCRRAGQALASRGLKADGLGGTGEEGGLVGRSSPMQSLYRSMARVIQTDLTVLIQGESGTGKELVARALHDLGARKNHPFVAVNMAAMPRELIESELFGHEKGAFTGALARTDGRFAQAAGGTLFLDEIGDMPLEVQTRLLRVLQQGEYTRVGGTQTVQTDVRIVAATHQDLPSLIRDGRFREDLFYRLNVVPLQVPPLRQRTEDIPDLVSHFLAQAQAEGLPPKTLEADALNRLTAHSWPGNVRELENLVRRLCALYPEERLDADVIDAELDPPLDAGPKTAGAPRSLEEAAEHFLSRYFAAHGDGLPPRGLHDRIIREIERPLLSMTLAATRGNQLKAAEVLGLNRNTLRKKIRSLGIRPSRTGR